MPKDYSRTERIAAAMQKELSQIIRRDVKDPRLGQFLSVSAVEVSKDLAHAKVYISSFDDHHIEVSLTILNKASGFIRKRLGQEIKLRVTPQLIFKHDSSIAEGNRLSQLIDKAMEKNTPDEKD